jgi:hypothetical protein
VTVAGVVCWIDVELEAGAGGLEDEATRLSSAESTWTRSKSFQCMLLKTRCSLWQLLRALRTLSQGSVMSSLSKKSLEEPPAEDIEFETGVPLPD